MNLLQIKALQVTSLIGVHAWEQTIPQALWVDLEVQYDLHKAAISDNIADALDYTLLADHIRTFASQQHCQLIERLASLMANSLEEQFGFTHFSLTLHKPQALGHATDVAVVVTRPEMNTSN